LIFNLCTDVSIYISLTARSQDWIGSHLWVYSSRPMLARDSGCRPSSCHSYARTGRTAVALSRPSWQVLGQHAVPGRRTGWLRTLLWTNRPTASKHRHEKPKHTKRVVSGKWQVASGKWLGVRCAWWLVNRKMNLPVWVYVYDSICWLSVSVTPSVYGLIRPEWTGPKQSRPVESRSRKIKDWSDPGPKITRTG